MRVQDERKEGRFLEKKIENIAQGFPQQVVSSDSLQLKKRKKNHTKRTTKSKIAIGQGVGMG